MAPRARVLSACNGWFAGVREQRLIDSTIHQAVPPESRHSPPALYAALPTSSVYDSSIHRVKKWPNKSWPNSAVNPAQKQKNRLSAVFLLC
jgi:hypothetical protein